MFSGTLEVGKIERYFNVPSVGPRLEMRETHRARERLRPFVEQAQRFTGWNMDRFAPKPLGPGPPWSYEHRAGELLTGATSVLDLGTGGGEVFGELCHSYTGRAVATELWHVNAPIAATRLSPRGIAVVRCSSLVLPFGGGVFDVVLSRHEELDPAEVARVGSPHGSVLTQQVGRNQWIELREFFPDMQDFGDLFRRYQNGLRAAGLTIVQAQTHDGKVAYRRLGDVVFMLCISPWSFPNLDPLGRDLPALLDLERTLSTSDGIVLTESRFLIEATKVAR